MENLPIEIIENILHRLPVEPILQSKRVCKTWRNIIGKNKLVILFAYADVNNLSAESGAQVQLFYGDEFEFDDKQFYMYETNTKLDRVKYNFRAEEWFEYNHLVGSCNGLVCLQSYNQVTKSSCVGICNPLTGEFVILPDSDGWFVLGFGYLPSTNEYKVVRCNYTVLNNVRKGHMEVYTLGSQCGWREKETIPYKFFSSGFFANGAIHWIGEINRGSRIVAYDLADEKFKDIPSLPFDFLKRHDALTGRFQLLRGKLCVILYRPNEILIRSFEKREIKNTRTLRPRRTQYYDHSWGWSKEFNIPNKDPEAEMYKCRLFGALANSNTVLLWHEPRKLYCYDNDTSTLTLLRDGDSKDISCLQTIIHMNTLVSLKDLGECSCNSVTLDNDDSKISIQQRKRRKR